MDQTYNNNVIDIKKSIRLHIAFLLNTKTVFNTNRELILSVCECPQRRYYDRISHEYKVVTIQDEIYACSVANYLNELLCTNFINIRSLLHTDSWILLPSDYVGIDEEEADYSWLDDVDVITDKSHCIRKMTHSENDPMMYTFEQEEPPNTEENAEDNVYIYPEEQQTTEDNVDYVYFCPTYQQNTENIDWKVEELQDIDDFSSSTEEFVEPQREPQREPVKTMPLPGLPPLHIPTERTSGCAISRLTGKEYDELINMTCLC